MSWSHYKKSFFAFWPRVGAGAMGCAPSCLLLLVPVVLQWGSSPDESERDLSGSGAASTTAADRLSACSVESWMRGQCQDQSYAWGHEVTDEGPGWQQQDQSWTGDTLHAPGESANHFQSGKMFLKHQIFAELLREKATAPSYLEGKRWDCNSHVLNPLNWATLALFPLHSCSIPTFSAHMRKGEFP